MESKEKVKYLLIEEKKELKKDVKPSSYLDLWFKELQNGRYEIIEEFDTYEQATEELRKYMNKAESFSKIVDLTVYYVDCLKYNDEIEEYESFGYVSAPDIFTDDYFELSSGRRIFEKDFSDISIEDFFENKEYALNLIGAILAENKSKELIIKLQDRPSTVEMTFLKDESDGYNLKLTTKYNTSSEYYNKLVKYLEENKQDYIYNMLYNGLVIKD